MACEVCKKPYVPDENSFDCDRKPHLCKICGKTFALKKQLKLHLSSHESNVPFVCNTCEKNQSSSYNLRLSKQGNFVCETCNKCFTTKRSLLRHAGEHTMENILNCEECGEPFKNMTAMKKHLTIHKTGRSHSKTIKRKQSVDDIDPSYQCEECGKIFTKLKQYETHCLNHKKYYCGDCNVYFASNKLLKEHLDSGGCHLKFESSLDSSNSNNISNNSDESKKNTCSLCYKSFARKSALEGHMLSHFMDNHESPVEDDSDKDMDFQCNLKDEKSNELCLPKLKIRRSFDCGKCSLEFSSRISLNKHMLSHEEKPENIVQASPEIKKTYTCRQCLETFELKDSYKQHKLQGHSALELNSEERTYTCQLCLKAFAKRKHLKKHVKIHLDDHSTDDSNLSQTKEKDGMMLKREKKAKNFACGYCGKLFAGETCWRKHEAKHEGDDKDKEDDAFCKSRKGKKAKPLICEFCNEDFTGKRQLYVKHKHSHTPEVCGICDARFTDRASLREHCRIHIGTEEGRRFLECSQKVLDAKNGVVAQPEPKVEYIYLVLR